MSITLPNDSSLAVSHLKAFADDKLNVAQNIKFVFHWVENKMGKSEIFFFPLFHNFQKASSSWISKPFTVW